MPLELIGFKFERHEVLSSEQKFSMLEKLKSIPRPPPSLHKLISPEFINSATSEELISLVMGEPLIAAKIIARVNSPFYGLQKSVSSIGPAITFLGFNTVRSIGLQYMMTHSFMTNNQKMNLAFESILASSAIASDLTYKLANKLSFTEPGSMVTQVVLSFIGKLSTQWLMPPSSDDSWRTSSFFERLKDEQAALGLGSAEIGALLMKEWDLPESVISDVLNIDRIVVTPARFNDQERAARLGLKFLCARLGERLALGTLNNLSDFNIEDEKGADFFNFRSYVSFPHLEHVFEHLKSPEIVASVKAMQEAITHK